MIKTSSLSRKARSPTITAMPPVSSSSTPCVCERSPRARRSSGCRETATLCVVPAHAGTYNHRRLWFRRVAATTCLKRNDTEYGFPRSRERRTKNGRDSSRPFSFSDCCASPRRRGAGRWRRQRSRSAVQQRRDIADGDTPIDAAGSIGLFFQILFAVTLRGQVFRRHLELLGQQLGGGFGAAIRQRQIVDIRSHRVGV